MIDDPRERDHRDLVDNIITAAETLRDLGWNRMHDATPYEYGGYKFLVLWCWLDEEKTRIGWFVDYLFGIVDPFYISLEFHDTHKDIVEAARAGWEALLGAPVDAVRQPKCGDRVYLVLRRPKGTPWDGTP